MVAEGELRSNVDDSDRVRELQDKVVDLKAEVSIVRPISYFVPKTVSKWRYDFIRHVFKHETCAPHQARVL